MAVTLKQVEGVPAAWPAKPTGLSTEATALDVGIIWGRIEQWIARRWSSRSIVWTVEGSGEWVPPLAPAIITTVEVWSGAWGVVTLGASPLGGYDLDTEGPYRFTGTVGAGPVPLAGQEAYRRLAEYSAEVSDYSMMKGRAGASSVDAEIGPIHESFSRSPSWAAKAMHNSGAADLLRPYRKV